MPLVYTGNKPCTFINSNMKRLLLLTFYAVTSTLAAEAQTGSFVVMQPGDTEKDIIAKAAAVKPSPRQLRWQQLELTAFFHFGMNTFTNKEWGDGTEDISHFNPTELNARQWVSVIKKAGFKQAIITAKHHDGFCLWPTKYTEHSIAHTPYKNGKGDIVKEVADACHEAGVGFGVYLSPWDRNSAFYGDSVAYNDYFVHQMTELLTQYGQVDEVWLDGANGEGPNGKKQWYDFDRWYTLIRKLQPQAVIAIMGPDVRWVGTESGVGRETEWSVLPVSDRSQESIAARSQKDVMIKPEIPGKSSDGDRGGRDKIAHAKALIWYPAETDVSIRPGWFYHSKEDARVKTPQQLMNIYATSVGRNSVLLLNLPPDPRGLINAADSLALMHWKQRFDSVYGNNLARRAVISSNGKIVSTALTDSKLATTAPVAAGDTSCTIHLQWKQPVTFNLLSLQENIAIGQRVEKFVIEQLTEKGWQECAGGTTIGYKRILTLDNPVTTKELRVRILSSRLTPALAELGVFLQP